MADAKNAGGTVLLRRSALGDVVLLGAVAGGVPRPVTVATSPVYVGLVSRMLGVDRAVSWPANRDELRKLGGTVIDLQASARSLALAPLAARVDKQSVRRRLGLVVRGIAGRPPVTELYAQACGVRAAPPPWFSLPDVPRDALALIPGASTALKCWREAGFIAVGRAWDGPVLVLGGPGEEDLCQRVADGIPGADVVVERGFVRTLDALARTRVAVANDAGLMHLAFGCGAAVVAVAGPTHPRDGFLVHGPVVGRELDCRPCTLHRRTVCPRGDHACMDVDAALVIREVRACASR